MRSVHAHLIRMGALAVASTTALGLAAGVGGAAPTATANSGTSGHSTAAPADLSGLKAKAAEDVDDRVNALNRATDKVNGAKSLGSGQSTLVAYLGTDVTPLQQLNEKIQNDTTYQQALTDFRDIFTYFRVYALVLPAAAIAGDAFRATDTVIPNLTSASSKAQARVDDGNRNALQPVIDDLNGQIATAAGATNGVAATVLAFTPAQWNADHGLLATAKGQDQTADTAIRRGRADVRDIVQIVRGSTNGAATTTTS